MHVGSNRHYRNSGRPPAEFWSPRRQSAGFHASATRRRRWTSLGNHTKSPEALRPGGSSRPILNQPELALQDAACRQGLAYMVKNAGINPPSACCHFRGPRGEQKEAVEVFTEVLASQRRRFTSESTLVAATLANLGMCYIRRDKPAEAEPLFREALAIREKQMPNYWLRFLGIKML